MPIATTLPFTAAALPSLSFCLPRHRRRLRTVQAWTSARRDPLVCPPILNQKTESANTTMPDIKKASSLLLRSGALMASVAQPALAVTGNNNNFDDDLTSLLIQAAIVAVGYFLVMPPVIMNWMRLRWYKRKFFEMYLQFMFVFIFFPGLLLWAPFLNFRRLPRDPTMEYPWSTPKDMSNNPSS